MRVTFLGVRGSVPTPGAAFLRYGGNTACVALAHDGAPPSLVLDGGTGIRMLDAHLCGAPFRGTVALSHLHWDHVHGLPFCAAALAPGNCVRVLVPSPDGDPVATLERGFSPPHFPVTPRDMGQWSYERIVEGVRELEGFSVTAREVPHKGGQTFGFRVEAGGAVLAYLTDHAPQALGPGEDGLGLLHESALELCAGADLLVHDAQFTAAEFPAVSYLGHAAAEYALGLAEAAGAKRLALFHHAPDRTDDDVDALLASLSSSGCSLLAASEGLTIDL